MKKLIFFFIAFNLLNQLQAQNVGIGTNNPQSSAVLDINSSSKGVLFPRLTYSQILNIANPANGLHVFIPMLLRFNFTIVFNPNG